MEQIEILQNQEIDRSFDTEQADYQSDVSDELHALQEFESGKYQAELCPECGSERTKLTIHCGDDEKYHEEFVCQDCGYTEA